MEPGSAGGRAHPGVWLFTQRARILKLPVGADLKRSLEDQPAGWRGIDGFPTEMAVRGYNHYGDPDEYQGFLFVPVESGKRAAIAVFSSSDLAFIDFAEVTRHQGRAAWLGVTRAQGLLYSSDGTVSASEPLLRYQLDLAPLRDERVPRERKLDRALDANRGDAALTLHSRFALSAPGAEDVRLFTMQGGVFSPRGDLYLVSSQLSFIDPGGITLWDSGGRLLERSQNSSGLGGFRYEFHGRVGEEPEGVDWWDRSRRPASPGVTGQLHTLLLDNDVSNDDDLYLKHYSVDYRCR